MLTGVVVCSSAQCTRRGLCYNTFTQVHCRLGIAYNAHLLSLHTTVPSKRIWDTEASLARFELFSHAQLCEHTELLVPGLQNKGGTVLVCASQVLCKTTDGNAF